VTEEKYKPPCITEYKKDIRKAPATNGASAKKIDTYPVSDKGCLTLSSGYRKACHFLQ
jgi:hypothetical protein